MLSAICWAAATPLLGGINRWTPSGPPDHVYGFAVGPDSTLYAGTPSGVFQSVDHGGSWILIHVNSAGLRGTLSEIAIDPNTPTILYGSRGSPDLPSVVKSTDGGITWTQSDAGLPPFTFLRIVVDPADSATIYGGGDRGVFKSTDGGSSWTRLGSSPSVSSLAIDPADPRRLYAASYNGPVFRTSDGGATWQQVIEPLSHPKVDVELDPADSSKVYVAAYCCATIWKSANRGSEWEQLRAAPTLIDDILVDPANPRTIYTGGSGGPTPGGIPSPPGGVFRSNDEGRTWSAFNAGIEYQVIRRLGSDSTGRFLAAVPSSANGTFVYQIQSEDVATLSELGLVVLTTLLAAGGALVLAQRGNG